MADLTPKMFVAVELLDHGVQMYFDKAYFAAIHLAGAAEELFGRYLELSKEVKPAATTIYDNVVVALGHSPETVPPKMKRQFTGRYTTLGTGLSTSTPTTTTILVSTQRKRPRLVFIEP